MNIKFKKITQWNKE